MAIIRDEDRKFEEKNWCRDYQGKTYSLQAFSDRVRAFHGGLAPGVVIGGRMVTIALDEIPTDTLFDAICETPHCLADAIQLLTLCTIGNGWLKVLPFGRFALALYDKTNGKGVRVCIDSARLNRWPVIHEWFFKTKPKHQQNRELLLDAIQSAGSALFAVRQVQIEETWRIKNPSGPIGVCPNCQEAYPQQHGKTCKNCQGQSPYAAR